MAITSHAFGRVTLTEDDAEKFAKQVRYGRTNESAKAAVARGLSMVRSLKGEGKITLSVSKPVRAKGGSAK